MGKIQPQRRSLSVNPWEALFSSVTRPRSLSVPVVVGCGTSTANTIIDIDSSNHNCRSDAGAIGDCDIDEDTIATSLTRGDGTMKLGGYTILIQHSMTCSSQRQCAVSSSTFTNSTTKHNDNKMITNTSSSGAPAVGKSRATDTVSPALCQPRPYGCWNDSMSGPIVVRQVFEELCGRCNGAVVFVSLLGFYRGSGRGVVDLDELDECAGMGMDDDHRGMAAAEVNQHHTQHSRREDSFDQTIYQRLDNMYFSSMQKRKAVMQSFRKNGACVDLSSNPFGWELRDTDTDGFVNTKTSNEDRFINEFCMHRSMICNLQTVIRTIREAASTVEHRRNHLRPHDSCTMQQSPHPEQPRKSQKPIPIVFDTLTPLLHYHGVEKIICMLKCLRSGAVVSSSPQTLPSSSYSSILSPIVAPVLYESLRPLEHRSLEDVADAMITLTLHRNCSDSSPETSDRAFTSILTNDNYSATIVPGMIDIVRRGGGGGGSSGGKFIRHCVPVQITRSLSTSIRITQPVKENWHWTFLNRNHQLVPEEQGIKSSISTSSRIRPTPSHPKISLQDDDDTENEIFDEEDDYDYG